MSNLVVKTLETVVAGKFVTRFAVVDGEGNLVGNKAHATELEAKAEMGGLKYYSRGLEFAQATNTNEQSDKALVGKANVVAAYLIWAEDQEKELSGVEVVEAEQETEEAEAGAEEPEESSDSLPEEEEF